MNGRMENKIKVETRIQNQYADNRNYLLSFLNYLSSKYEHKTKEMYLRYVNKFLEDTQKDIAEIDEDDIIAYLNKIAYTQKGDEIVETSGTYRATVHSSLKQYFNYLVSTNKISNNPILNVPRPKNKKSDQIKRVFLTPEEMQKLVDTVKDTDNARNMLIVRTFLYTGIRCTALTEINIEDVDINKRILKVIDKRNKVREFELDYGYIQLFLKVKGDRTSGPLFISTHKERINPYTVSRIIENLCKDISGKHITPHKLRRSYGTNLYNVTKDIYAVKEALGHENIDVTQLYVQTDSLEASRKGLAAMKGSVSF